MLDFSSFFNIFNDIGEALKGIAAPLYAAGEYLFTLVMGMKDLLDSLSEIVKRLPIWLGGFPPFFLDVAIYIVAVAIIFRVLGK